MHRLTYDHHTHRRCVCCEPVGGQYPLRPIVHVGTHVHVVQPGGSVLQCAITDSVLLDCGHLDLSHAEFVERNTPSENW